MLAGRKSLVLSEPYVLDSGDILRDVDLFPAPGFAGPFVTTARYRQCREDLAWHLHQGVPTGIVVSNVVIHGRAKQAVGLKAWAKSMVIRDLTVVGCRIGVRSDVGQRIKGRDHVNDSPETFISNLDVRGCRTGVLWYGPSDVVIDSMISRWCDYGLVANNIVYLRYAHIYGGKVCALFRRRPSRIGSLSVESADVANMVCLADRCTFENLESFHFAKGAASDKPAVVIRGAECQIHGGRIFVGDGQAPPVFIDGTNTGSLATILGRGRPG